MRTRRPGIGPTGTVPKISLPRQPAERHVWPKDKGEPNPSLANYGQNVDATTPEGRYPEGLMDMAGNVWEWMENWDDKDEDARALRGGSWIYDEVNLRCSARCYFVPHFWNDYAFGFRVVRCRL